MYRASKRLFDIVSSFLALCVLAVPFLFIMVTLRLTGEGDIWYFQDRIGYKGRRFRLMKFCTMRRDSEITGTRDITLTNDPRVFPVGRILRKTKINELPQLVNILKGDMSVVGWRPLTARPFGCYPAEVQQRITECVPGLTGVGSIVFRDEEGMVSRMGGNPEKAYRDHIAPYKGALEIWYTNHRSLWTDLKIILLTSWVIFHRNSRLYQRWLKDLPPRPAFLDRQPDMPAASAPSAPAAVPAKFDCLAQRIVGAVRRVIGDKQALLHAPCLEGNAEAYLLDCVRTAWVSTSGAYVAKFEQMLADYTGAKHAVATVNGTCALHASLVLAGVNGNDEVICPSLTFVATANAIRFCGATPHFCDIEPQTRGLDADKLDDHLKQIATVRDGACINNHTGRRISCLLVMHTLGHPANMDRLLDVAAKWRLKVIEDAAAGLGSYYKGKHVGRFGTFGALSFNSNKIITTGGGGAILCDNTALAERARHLTSTGKLPHPWRFVHDAVAWNYRMPNINAAMGCAQMEQLPSFRERKRRLACQYKQAFADIPDVSLISEPDDCSSNYWLNGVILKQPSAAVLDHVLEQLHNAGYLSRPIWHPMHQLDIYRDCPRMDMAVTDDLAQRIINLPSSPVLLS